MWRSWREREGVRGSDGEERAGEEAAHLDGWSADVARGAAGGSTGGGFGIAPAAPGRTASCGECGGLTLSLGPLPAADVFFFFPGGPLQPSGGISRVLFGGQMTEEEVDSVLNRWDLVDFGLWFWGFGIEMFFFSCLLECSLLWSVLLLMSSWFEDSSIS